MGLNEVYTVVRGNILMMNPLPSMAQAFSLLIQEEKQREFKPTGRMPMDSTSLNVNNLNNNAGSTGRTFRTNYQVNSYAGSSNNSGGNNNYTGNNYYSGSSSGRIAMFCDFCKRSGHIRDKCYKLHGYPQNNNQNFKPNTYNNGQNYRQNNQNFKEKKVVANVHGVPNDMMPTHGAEQSHNNNHQGITKEQYGQIVDRLQHFQIENVGEDQNNSTTNASPMNFAGFFSEEASGDW